jgi:PAS domain S-box-containing protein
MECTLRYSAAEKSEMNMEKPDFPAHMASHEIGRPIYMLKLLGVAALYALLAKVVLTFFSANGVVSIVWPPSGLALAVLLIGGKRYFPGVFLGAFIANAMTGLAPGVAAAIAAGNTLEALLGAWLLTRDGKLYPDIRTLDDYLRLIVLGGFVACGIAALNGSTTLLISGFIDTGTYFRNMLNWWMGDMLGVALFTPLILSLRRMPDGWREQERKAEIPLLLGLMFLANQVVFLEWFHNPNGMFEQVARGYWMFLFITLVAARLGICATVIALVMTAIQALWGAALGVGFFAQDIAKTGLTTFWFYMMTLSVVGMALATHLAERKRAEAKLVESELRFRAVAQSANDAIITMNSAGNIVGWNAAAEKIFGYIESEVIQQPMVMLMPERFRNLHNEGLARVLAGGAAHVIGKTVELTGLRKDGSEFPLELSLSQWKVSDNKFFTAITRDITERKQAENELREKEERLALATIQNGVGVWDWNLVTQEVIWDDSMYALYHIRREDFIGTEEAWRKALHPDDLSRGDQEVNDAIAGIKPFNTEFRVVWPNGEIHYIKAVAKVYRDEKGAPVRMLGINMDITERKAYEEELKRSNADLEQFSYAVSHDMRQPLRMISSYLQLLERSLAGQLDGEKHDYFNFAIEGAKRIDQMLVALLEYSRVGRKGEPPTWIESRALLNEALQFLQPAITEAQAKVNIAGEWPRILASRDEILRLIQNLIGNAAKYHIAGRTPEITVASEVTKNEWRLCVADNGVGIIPDQIKRLFQVFQRLQTRTAYEGTGIGLALCRKIAEHHKGRIWAESLGEGKGSKFCVVLPVLREKT